MSLVRLPSDGQRTTRRREGGTTNQTNVRFLFCRRAGSPNASSLSSWRAFRPWCLDIGRFYGSRRTRNFWRLLWRACGVEKVSYALFFQLFNRGPNVRKVLLDVFAFRFIPAIGRDLLSGFSAASDSVFLIRAADVRC